MRWIAHRAEFKSPLWTCDSTWSRNRAVELMSAMYAAILADSGLKPLQVTDDGVYRVQGIDLFIRNLDAEFFFDPKEYIHHFERIDTGFFQGQIAVDLGK